MLFPKFSLTPATPATVATLGDSVLQTGTTTTPATLATPATLHPFEANNTQSVASVATVATITKNKSTQLPEEGTVPAVPQSGGVLKFEQTGDPASCKFWFRVCWAVGMYQGHCTRSTDCLTYRFLQRHDDAVSQDDVTARNQAAESNRRNSV